jgi:formate hydrogenlyase subunit 3/multisubunit Na+/H+ antiporter MnhD subunit
VDLLVFGMALLLGSAVVAVLLARSPAASGVVAAVGGATGCTVGLVPTVQVLRGNSVATFSTTWDVPYGSISIGLDPLSAFFLAPLFLLGGLAAVYGREYLSSYRGRKSLAVPTAMLNIFVTSMAVVVVARGVVLFLVAWELMTLASYLLVTFEHEDEEVRRAGWVYLLAAHVGVASLILLFLLLGRHAAGLDFELFHTSPVPLGSLATLLFALAGIGFGIKAGVVPLHVWLPEAHAAAPSHVSALMSGVLIKLGIYGFLRVLTFLPATAWWGPLLIGLGLGGAFFGIALALYQRDLKRVLAYSSIENVGVVLLGIGVGYWGISRGDGRLATLGMYGGLLHLWNHALMKGLMFFAAGSVLHGAGTKDLERLGGLMKVMPWTATAMMVGAVAISALPPLNGFLGEWLIYLGLIGGGLAPHGVAAPFVVGGLALVGGLAALCFVRLAGVALLGAPRSREAELAHESSLSMVGPIWLLALSCVAAALFPAPVLTMMSKVPAQLLGPVLVGDTIVESSLATLGRCNAALWALLVALGMGLVMSYRGRSNSDATWGCGYANPTPRMQYTARSFSELLAERLLPAMLRARVRQTAPRGIFPAAGAYASECIDPLTRGVYEPFFDRWGARFYRLRWLQQGLLHVYLMYILTVVVLGLAWIALRSWAES